MNPDDYQKVKEIFNSVLEIEPDGRGAFLDEKCEGNDVLRGDVERLLRSYDSEYLEKPAVGNIAEEIAGDGLRTGHVIEHYTIIEKIGSGGMGEVYLAEDGKLGRQVAIKLLPEAFTKDDDRLRRFQQEARTASALNHPNILTIYEIGGTDTAKYIATEYIDGETLRAKLNRGKLPVAEALDIAVQCSSALAAAHEAGIIHRDIKPENIMLRRDNLVKLLDFGLAKLVEPKDITISHDAPTEKHFKTAPGMIMGTVQYMSPEQTRGHSTDARTDIWSLGVVIYEMAAGTPPFAGENTADLIAEIVKTHPAPISHFVGDVPEWLDEIVAKTLEKNPGERYQTAKDLLIDLKRLKRKLELETEMERSQIPATRNGNPVVDTDGEAKTIVTAQDTANTNAGSQRTASSAEYLVSEILRHKWKTFIAVVFGFAILAALGLGTYYLIQPQKDKVAQTNRVTTNGKAEVAAISHDGKYIAYSLAEFGKESLWVKHLPTQRSTQIIPPSETSYGDLTFSPDTNHIYYLERDSGSSRSEIHVVPVLGGTQKKLIENVNFDSFDLSRSGDRFVFSRKSTDQKNTDLIVANADGTGEKTILTRGGVYFPTWSPDGKRIAFVVGDAASQNLSSSIVEIQLEELKEKTIYSQGLYEISNLTWVSDDSGFFMIAKDQEKSPLQVWNLSYPDGKARRVTSDFNDYRGLSVASDLTKLVTVQSVYSSGIWVAERGDIERAKQITFGYGLDGAMGISWAPNGQIVYTSNTEGRQDIWIMNADGSDQRQLTLNSGINVEPSVSADNRYVVFVSDRSGSFQIWRMDIDGNRPIQLTNEAGGRFPQCSPDGKWVIYQSLKVWTDAEVDEPVTLWKVPIDGGNGERMTSVASEQPAVSADGKLLAYFADDDVFVMPLAGGEPRRILEVSQTVFGVPPYRQMFYIRIPYFRWLSDGTGLVYATHQGLWTIGLNKNTPKKVADFDGSLAFWDLSRDGKKMAYGKSAGATRDVVIISEW